MERKQNEHEEGNKIEGYGFIWNSRLEITG